MSLSLHQREEVGLEGQGSDEGEPRLQRAGRKRVGRNGQLGCVPSSRETRAHIASFWSRWPLPRVF